MLLLVCLSEQGVHPRHIAWRLQSGVMQPDKIEHNLKETIAKFNFIFL